MLPDRLSLTFSLNSSEFICVHPCESVAQIFMTLPRSEPIRGQKSVALAANHERFRQNTPKPSISTSGWLTLRAPPEVVDGRSAALDDPVIIDETKAARGKPRIKPVEHLDRRFVQIAVEPKNRDPLDRRGRHGVAETNL